MSDLIVVDDLLRLLAKLETEHAELLAEARDPSLSDEMRHHTNGIATGVETTRMRVDRPARAVIAELERLRQENRKLRRDRSTWVILFLVLALVSAWIALRSMQG